MTGPFDLWFSWIVLQHNPPPIIALILRRCFSLLAPGGVAVFQVPTYATGYRFRIAEYLGRIGDDGGIEMHVLPQHVVLGLAAAAGCQPLEIWQDGAAGSPSAWTSNTFVFRKPAAQAATALAAPVAAAAPPATSAFRSGSLRMVLTPPRNP